MLLFLVRWALVLGGAFFTYQNAETFFENSQTPWMLILGLTLVMVGGALSAYRHATETRNSTIAICWVVLTLCCALADVLLLFTKAL